MNKMYSNNSEVARRRRIQGAEALVAEALSNCSGPITLEALAPLVDRMADTNSLLNEWANENGGVKRSIRYHLRELGKRGMVKVEDSPNRSGHQIVGWGNSQALRIPRAMLERCRSAKGTKLK